MRNLTVELYHENTDIMGREVHFNLYFKYRDHMNLEIPAQIKEELKEISNETM
jgi:hypothetical protein